VSSAAHLGRLFVIAAPSGAGKTSLVKALVERRPDLHVSVSYTTRPRRPTEQPGQDYRFVSVDEFRSLIAREELLEHAQVFGNFYGTARSPVEEQLAAGHHVILEIDWQGARQVRQRMPESTTVLILPPSREILEQRLRQRGTDALEVIARRLREAASEMSHWMEFRYVVVNDSFERAVQDLNRVIDGRAEDLDAARPAVKPLLARLL
jgi:guanylate kinase